MAGYNQSMYPYFDQGETGGPPTPFGMTEPPPYDASKELREGDWAYRGLPREIANLLAPNLGEDQRPFLESAMLDAGQFLNAPERGAMAAKSALGPLAAGMIRWSKNEARPNAMLHRRIGDLRELDWWNKLFQKGESTQAPTSLVTPSVLQSFASEPYGLMFNVNKPEQIVYAGVGDLWSRKLDRPLPVKFAKMERSAYNKFRDAQSTGPKELVDKLWKEYGVVDDIVREAYPLGKNWEPTDRELYEGLNRSNLLRDPKDIDLRTFLSDQLRLAKERGGQKHDLWHSEVIPEIDRSMLAGVRLPMTNNVWPRYYEGSTKVDMSSPAPIVKALIDFAEQQNVPIYRWPAVETIDQEIKGLSGDPFRGKWGWKPGSREYKTSSQLPEIFGIRDLP